MASDDEAERRTQIWPLWSLRLSTDRLELRLPSEDEAVHLAAVAPDDLETDPAWPLPEGPRPLASGVLRGYFRALGQWKIDSWVLPFGVWLDGDPIGFQALEAERFALLGTVETSSWLVPRARGSGLGKEMRAAVLALAFDHLGAARAVSGAWEWNQSSLGVSRALGYVDNGWDFESHAERSGVMRRVILEKDQWNGDRWGTKVEGLEACRAWFGATA
ncbi:MAG TPA: GNAT family protein [Acidimicrobiales bacterium]|nr:GNAT family protein [Acidimicrobiales bacterium]